MGLTESLANLRRLRALAPGPRWLWLTPAPVHEERVSQFPPFRFGGSAWHNEDIVALAEAMHGLDDPVVDLVTAFGVPADPELQGADGIHPTLAGQAAIVRGVVTKLAAPGS